MSSTVLIAGYLCTNYPHPDEISEARLIKMMYLADWRSSILHGSQITKIRWTFNHYGPYTREATDELLASGEFDVKDSRTVYGNQKRVFSVRPESKLPFNQIPGWQNAILDFVIETTHTKTWSSFISLVYSTYPITTQARYSSLDLPLLAQQYREARDGMGWNVPNTVVPISDPLE